MADNEIIGHEDKEDRRGNNNTIWILLAFAGVAGVGYIAYTMLRQQKNEEDTAAATNPNTLLPETGIGVKGENYSIKYHPLSKSATITALTEIKLGGGISIPAGESLVISADDISYYTGMKKFPPTIHSFKIQTSNGSLLEDITIPKNSLVRLAWDTAYWKTLTLTDPTENKTHYLTKRKAYLDKQVNRGTRYALAAIGKDGQKAESFVAVRIAEEEKLIGR